MATSRVSCRRIIIPAENPDNDKFTRKDCLPEILLDFGRQRLSQLAGWLASWPGKPDYVVLEAVLGPVPNWPIREGLGGFRAKCGPRLIWGAGWLAVAGWLKLAGRLAVAACLAGRPGYSKSIVFLIYFLTF